jgi:hypothetical protein
MMRFGGRGVIMKNIVANGGWVETTKTCHSKTRITVYAAGIPLLAEGAVAYILFNDDLLESPNHQWLTIIRWLNLSLAEWFLIVPLVVTGIILLVAAWLWFTEKPSQKTILVHKPGADMRNLY